MQNPVAVVNQKAMLNPANISATPVQAAGSSGTFPAANGRNRLLP